MQTTEETQMRLQPSAHKTAVPNLTVRWGHINTERKA